MIRPRPLPALLALALAGCGAGEAPPAASAPASLSVTASVTATASAPATAPPPPIGAALPRLAALGPLERRVECAMGACALAEIVPASVAPPAGAPFAAWEHRIGKGAAVTVPYDEKYEVMGVVLAGSIHVKPVEKGTANLPGIKPWRGFRAPGGGVAILAEGGDARVLLVVASADPPGSPLASTLAAHAKAPPSGVAFSRFKRLQDVDFDALPDLAWAGGAYHARIGWEASAYRHGMSDEHHSKSWVVDDKPAAVLDTLLFSPSAGVAEHLHDKEWEGLVVLEGEGDLVRRPDPNGAGEPMEVRSGSIVYIPAGMKHAWEPRGTAPLVAIQIYGPPGPEQRFKKLAARP